MSKWLYCGKITVTELIFVNNTHIKANKLQAYFVKIPGYSWYKDHFYKSPFSSSVCLRECNLFEQGKERSSPPEVFLGNVFLKICSKSRGEHPCRSVLTKSLTVFRKSFNWDVSWDNECVSKLVLHFFGMAQKHYLEL